MSRYDDWSHIPTMPPVGEQRERCPKKHETGIRTIHNEPDDELDPDPRPNRFCWICGRKWRQL